jgi:hypothetical protein
MMRPLSVFCKIIYSIEAYKIFLLQAGYRAVSQQQAALATTASSRVEGDRSPGPSPGRSVRKRIEGGSNLFDRMNER